MKIELTRKQYKTLLKLIYWGEWMANSHKEEKDQLYKETDELEQLIYSFYKEYEMEKWIEYEKELKMFTPTIEMENDLDEIINEYDQRQIEYFLDEI